MSLVANRTRRKVRGRCIRDSKDADYRLSMFLGAHVARCLGRTISRLLASCPKSGPMFASTSPTRQIRCSFSSRSGPGFIFFFAFGGCSVIATPVFRPFSPATTPVYCATTTRQTFTSSVPPRLLHVSIFSIRSSAETSICRNHPFPRLVRFVFHG